MKMSQLPENKNMKGRRTTNSKSHHSRSVQYDEPRRIRQKEYDQKRRQRDSSSHPFGMSSHDGNDYSNDSVSTCSCTSWGACDIPQSMCGTQTEAGVAGGDSDYVTVKGMYPLENEPELLTYQLVQTTHPMDQPKVYAYACISTVFTMLELLFLIVAMIVELDHVLELEDNIIDYTTRRQLLYTSVSIKWSFCLAFIVLILFEIVRIIKGHQIPIAFGLTKAASGFVAFLGIGIYVLISHAGDVWVIMNSAVTLFLALIFALHMVCLMYLVLKGRNTR